MIFNDGQSPASSSLSFEDSNDFDSFAASIFDGDAGTLALTLDSHFDATSQPMSAATFDQWSAATLGGQYPSSESFAGPLKSSDETFLDWQSAQNVDFSNAGFLGSMPFPQRQISAHRRRLSHSSIPSQSSASPYSQPASLQYPSHQQPGGIDPSSQYMESSYSNYQSPQFQAHNLPTPSHTPTSDTFSERSHRRSMPMHHSKLGLAQNQTRNTVSQQQYAGGDSSAWQTGSTYGQELPNTPRTLGGGDESDEAYHSSAMRSVPKFDRTMSTAYQDELYVPPQPNTQQQQQQRQQIPQNYNLLSPYQHSWTQQERAAHSDTSSRDNSPFRHGSHWMQTHPTGFNEGQINTATRMRAQQKQEADALAYQQHMTHTSQPQNTVSPKDVVNHDYQNAEEPAPPSLFPDTSIPESSGGQDDSFNQASHRGDYYRQPEVSLPRQGSQVPTSNFTFVATTPASGSQFSGGKTFAPPAFRYQNSSSSQMAEFAPPPLVSMDTSASEDNAQPDAPIERPASTTADSGTYTCTYHGCSQRFESPVKLQKHKREDHRSAHHGHVSHAQQQQQQQQQHSSSATPELADRNSQAGPHKCERINPTTGKPCNTIFSRPYDLTRHEDTIHNAKKKKVRCQYCTEDKTFSRADALSRHMRVVHPDIEFPGKHGRKRHE